MQPASTDPASYAFGASINQQTGATPGSSSSGTSRPTSRHAHIPTDPRLAAYAPDARALPNEHAAYPAGQMAYPMQMPPPSYHIPDSSYQQQAIASSSRGSAPVSPGSRDRKRTHTTSTAGTPSIADGVEYEEDWQPEDEDANGDDGGPDGGRALKQTRRAIQNRLAQRAFRERKESYMRDLETRSQELSTLQAAIEQAEARRMEVEGRAKALAERAMALDAQEQAVASGEAARPLQADTADVDPPSNLSPALREEWQTTRRDLLQIRRQLAERDVVTSALRRALEEVSMVNGRLRSHLQQGASAANAASASGPEQEVPPASPERAATRQTRSTKNEQ